MATIESLETLTLRLHILAGFLALFGGAGALLTQKGGRRHRRAGRVYVYSMAFVAGSALLLFAFDATPTRQFLALIAVFSFYFVFSGFRVLSRKRPGDAPATIDRLAAVALLAAGLGLLGYGGIGLLDGDGFGTVLVVFGGISVAFGVRDLRSVLAEPPASGEWLYEHLSRMSAGYIATVTAFSSVNVAFLPPVLRWLWPTLVGTPLIAYFVRRY